MRLAAAIYWYQKQEISMEKAANVAGLNRRDFLAVLAREQVDVFTVDFDDLQREFNRG
jgi:predicted HTH domain antitoxin